MNQNRTRAYRAGFRAELIASLYLMGKGYRILARRYKTRVGEIDLVIANKKRLAFVEVKARATRKEALEAVTSRQQQRIRRAASLWVAEQKTPIAGDTGFDVIAIVPWKMPRHYRDAFSHTNS